MALQHLRSSTAHKRPIPTVMSAGQIAINTNEASPALFFKDSNGDLVKVGPVHVGTSAPNSSPASVVATALVTGTVYQILTVGTSDFTLVGAASNTVGTIFTATGTTTGTGTVSGQQGVEKGEMWLDTTGGTYVLKIYDGSAWRSESGTFVDSAGDTMTGALLLDNAASASAPDLSFDGDADTGVYSPGANQVAIATGGNGRVFIDSSGNVGVGTSSPGKVFEIKNAAPIIRLTDTDNNYSEISANTSILSFRADEGNGASSSRIDFRIDGSEVARIDSSGRLGVGLTPSADASITNVSAGLIQTDGNIDIRYPGSNSDPAGTRYLSLINTDSTLVAGQPMGGIRWVGNDTSNTSRDTASILAFCQSNSGTSSNITFNNDGGTERMRIDSSGNVGIGTSSPSNLVHIAGTGSDLTGLRIVNTQHNAGVASTAQQKLGITNSLGERNVRIQAREEAVNSNSVALDFFTNSASATDGETVKMTIKGTGNVGIGTTNPGQLIQIGEGDTGVGTNVHSIARIEGRAVGGGEQVATLEFNQITNAPSEFVGASIGIESSAGTRSESELVFKVSQGTNTDATEAMRLSHDGRLGIGTASPTREFDVVTTDRDCQVRFESTHTGGDARLELIADNTGVSQIRFGDQDTVNVGHLTYEHNNNAMSFKINNSEKARFDSSGRLLIGLSSDVSGSANNVLQLMAVGGARLVLGRDDASISSGNTVGDIQFYGNDAGTQTQVGFVRCSAGASYTATSKPTALLFGTTASDSTDATERMRIDQDGNVGIGDASPDQLLHITGTNPTIQIESNGGVGDTARLLFRVADTGGTVRNMAQIDGLGTGSNAGALRFFARISGNLTEAARIDSSGNLGINTDNPSNLLDVASANGDGIRIGASTAGTITRETEGLRITGASTNKVISFVTAGSEAMRVDTSGNVGIGNIAPGAKLQIEGTSDQLKLTYTSIASYIHEVHSNSDYSISKDATERIRITSSGAVGIDTSVPSAALAIGNYNGTKGIALQTDTADSGYIYFADGSSGDALFSGFVQYDHPIDALRIGTASTEQMRIDSSGNVLTGKSNVSLATVGHALLKASYASHTVSGNPCLRLNRLASDGALVQFYQAGSLEGSISVSGTTVSYNGAHLSRWSQLANGAERFEILRGSVLSNLDEMCEWSEENNEQLNRMKVSDVEGDRNVSGVFQAWDDDDDTYTNDFYCAMTGDFVIRIAQGVTVERGDLLMSAGDGTAKPQDDDIIRSKTIAKVTSSQISETYADGSYCVPCVLMAC